MVSFFQQLFTNQFTKDFLLSIAIIASLYGITHNPIVRPTPQPMPGNWSIQFMQHPLLFGFAGHNYLALRDQDGAIISELHGLATDPFTGEWKYIGSKATDKLRVWEFESGRYYLAEKTFPGIVLKEGNEENIRNIWSTGMSCKDPINDKDITYPPYGVSIRNETINSNSVAYTLAKCMNLDTRHIGIWTPGDTMNLLK
jgi:hypothetical protein